MDNGLVCCHKWQALDLRACSVGTDGRSLLGSKALVRCHWKCSASGAKCLNQYLQVVRENGRNPSKPFWSIMATAWLTDLGHVADRLTDLGHVADRLTDLQITDCAVLKKLQTCMVCIFVCSLVPNLHDTSYNIAHKTEIHIFTVAVTNCLHFVNIQPMPDNFVHYVLQLLKEQAVHQCYLSLQSVKTLPMVCSISNVAI